MAALIVGIAWEMFHYFGLSSAWVSRSKRVDSGRRGLMRLTWMAEPVVMSLMLACCVFLQGQGNAFIYFQF